MARKVKVPRTYRIEATAILRDGQTIREAGESHGSNIGEAMDNWEVDPSDLSLEGDDVIRVTLDVRETGA